MQIALQHKKNKKICEEEKKNNQYEMKMKMKTKKLKEKQIIKNVQHHKKTKQT